MNQEQLKVENNLKMIRYDFSKEKELMIIPVGDIHIGAKESYYKNLIKIANRYPQAKFILLGDLINNSIKSSKVNPHDDILRPAEQQKELISFIKQIGKSRFLGCVAGNHENRTTRVADIQPLESIMLGFDIPYDPNILLLDISVGKRQKDRSFNYTILFGHGAGGGRTKGSATNAAYRLRSVNEHGVDIYLSGHTHKPQAMKCNAGIYDKKNKKATTEPYWIMTCSSWVGHEEYAKQKMFEPPAFCLQKIILAGEKEKNIKIEME